MKSRNKGINWGTTLPDDYYQEIEAHNRRVSQTGTGYFISYTRPDDLGGTPEDITGAPFTLLSWTSASTKVSPGQIAKPSMQMSLYHDPMTGQVGYSTLEGSRLSFFSASVNYSGRDESSYGVSQFLSPTENFKAFLYDPFGFGRPRDPGIGPGYWSMQQYALTPQILQGYSGLVTTPSKTFHFYEKEGKQLQFVRSRSQEDIIRMSEYVSELTGEPFAPRSGFIFHTPSRMGPESITGRGYSNAKDIQRLYRGASRIFNERFQPWEIEEESSFFRGQTPQIGTRQHMTFLDIQGPFGEGTMYQTERQYVGQGQRFSFKNLEGMSETDLFKLGLHVGALYGRHAPEMVPEGYTFYQGSDILGQYSLDENEYALITNMRMSSIGPVAELFNLNSGLFEQKSGPGFKFVSQFMNPASPLVSSLRSQLGNFPIQNIGTLPSKPGRLQDIALKAYRAQDMEDQLDQFVATALTYGLTNDQAMNLFRIRNPEYDELGNFLGGGQLEFKPYAEKLVNETALTWFKQQAKPVKLTFQMSGEQLGLMKSTDPDSFQKFYEPYLPAGAKLGYSNIYTLTDFPAMAYNVDILGNPLPLRSTGVTNLNPNVLNMLARQQPQAFAELTQRHLAGEFYDPSQNLLRAAAVTQGMGEVMSFPLNSDPFFDAWRSVQNLSPDARPEALFSRLGEVSGNKFLSLPGNVTLPPASDFTSMSRNMRFDVEGNVESKAFVDGVYAALNMLGEGILSPADTERIKEQLVTASRMGRAAVEGRGMSIRALSGAATVNPLIPYGTSVANYDDMAKMIYRMEVSPSQRQEMINRLKSEGWMPYLHVASQANQALNAELVRMYTVERANELWPGSALTPPERGNAQTSMFGMAGQIKDLDADFAAYIPFGSRFSFTSDISRSIGEPGDEITSLLKKLLSPGLSTQVLANWGGYKTRSALDLQRGMTFSAYSEGEMQRTWDEGLSSFAQILGGATPELQSALSSFQASLYQPAMDVNPSKSQATNRYLEYLDKLAIGIPSKGGVSLIKGATRGSDLENVLGPGIRRGDTGMYALRSLDTLLHMQMFAGSSREENREIFLGNEGPGFAHALSTLMTPLGADRSTRTRILSALTRNFEALQDIGTEPRLMRDPATVAAYLQAVSGPASPEEIAEFYGMFGQSSLQGYKGSNRLLQTAKEVTTGSMVTPLTAYMLGAGGYNTVQTWHGQPQGFPRAQEMADLYGRVQTGIRFRRGGDLEATLPYMRTGYTPLAGEEHVAGYLTRGIDPYGKAGGGFTGHGGKYEPAGIVHRGEYVLTQEDVTAIQMGRGNQVISKVEEDLSVVRVAANYWKGGYVGGLPGFAEDDPFSDPNSWLGFQNYLEGTSGTSRTRRDKYASTGDLRDLAATSSSHIDHPFAPSGSTVPGRLWGTTGGPSMPPIGTSGGPAPPFSGGSGGGIPPSGGGGSPPSFDDPFGGGYFWGHGPQGRFGGQFGGREEYEEYMAPSRSDVSRGRGALRYLRNMGSGFSGSTLSLAYWTSLSEEQRVNAPEEMQILARRAAGTVSGVLKARDVAYAGGFTARDLPEDVNDYADLAQELSTAWTLGGGQSVGQFRSEEQLAGLRRRNQRELSRIGSRYNPSVSDVESFSGAANFIANFDNMSEVVGRLNDKQELYINQVERLTKIYDGVINTISNADAMLAKAQSLGGGIGDLPKGIQGILGAATPELRAQLGGMSDIMSTARGRLGQIALNRAVNLFPDEEAQQSWLTNRLLARGRAAGFARRDIPDELYEQGWDVGIGAPIRGRTAITALAGATRFTESLNRSMWAYMHANWWVLDPMQQQMAGYEQSEMMRSQVLAASGSISGGDLYSGMYGDIMRRQGSANIYQRSLGEQIYTAYGGVGGAGSSSLGRTVGGAVAVGGPALGAAMMASQIFGAAAGPIAGVGVGAAATLNYAYQFGTSDNSLAQYARDISNAGSQGGIGGLASTFLTIAPNLAANLGAAGRSIFDPGAVSRAGALGTAMSDFDALMAGNSTVRWSGMSVNDIISATQAQAGVSRGTASAAIFTSFSDRAGAELGLSPEQSSAIWGWNQRYNRGWSPNDMFNQRMRSLLPTVGFAGDLASDIYRSMGYSVSDPTTVLSRTKNLVDNLSVMSPEQQVAFSDRTAEGIGFFGPLNQSRLSVGLPAYDPSGNPVFPNDPQARGLWQAGDPVLSQTYGRYASAMTSLTPYGDTFGAYYSRQLYSLGASQNYLGQRALISALPMAMGMMSRASDLGVLGTSQISSMGMGVLGLNEDQQRQLSAVLSGDRYQMTASYLAGRLPSSYNLMDMQTGADTFEFGISNADYGNLQNVASMYGMSDVLMGQSQIAGGRAGIQRQLYDIQRTRMNDQYNTQRNLSLFGYNVTTGNLGAAATAASALGFGFNPGNGMGMWQLEDASVALTRQQQNWSQFMTGRQLDINQQQFNLSGSQFYENIGLSQRRLNTQIAQQYTEMGIDYSRRQTQFDWQEEDLQYSRDQLDVNFGWSMEDYTRNIRYARGRQKRDLMREQQRATVSYAMQAGRLDTQEGRLDTQRGWSQEDFERQKRYFEQNKQFQQEAIDLQKKHFEEGRNLDRQRLQLAQQSHQLEIQWLQQSRQLEDQNRQLSRQSYQIEQQAAIQLSQRAFEAQQQTFNLNMQLSLMNNTMAQLVNQAQLFNQTGQTGGYYTGGNIGGSVGTAPPVWGSNYGPGNTPPTFTSPTPLPPVSGTGARGGGGGGYYAEGGSVTSPRGVTHFGEYVVPQGGALVVRGDSGQMTVLKAIENWLAKLYSKEAPSIKLVNRTGSSMVTMQDAARANL